MILLGQTNISIEHVLLFGVLACVVLGAFWLASVQQGRAYATLLAWARHHDYRLLHVRNCLIARGPFTLVAGKDKFVYCVTIQDPAGQTRKGWVCGSFWNSSPTQVEVRWDEHA